MRKGIFINSILWVVIGIISIVGILVKCNQPFALIPIILFMLGLLTTSAATYGWENEKATEGSSLLMAVLLAFSGQFAFWGYLAGPMSPIMKVIFCALAIVAPSELICKHLDVLAGEAGEESPAEKAIRQSIEKSFDEKRKDLSNAEEEHVEEKKEERSIYDQLIEIGNKCPNTRESIIKALDQINELKELKETLERLDAIIYNKTTFEALKRVYEKLVLYVGQNMRDILAVCIAGRAIKNNGLTKEELKTIDHELKCNENKINRFKDNLRRAAKSSIQKNDAFSDLDIESEFAAIDSFTQLKDNEDIFSPANKNGA